MATSREIELFVCDLKAIQVLLWGEVTSPDPFHRWAQGFVFSSSEPSALEQRAGGPCAILAPVQAYMLKHILETDNGSKIRTFTIEEQKLLLVQALVEILTKCSNKSLSNGKYFMVKLDESKVYEKPKYHSDNIASTSTYPKPTGDSIPSSYSYAESTKDDRIVVDSSSSEELLDENRLSDSEKLASLQPNDGEASVKPDDKDASVQPDDGEAGIKPGQTVSHELLVIREESASVSDTHMSVSKSDTQIAQQPSTFIVQESMKDLLNSPTFYSESEESVHTLKEAEATLKFSTATEMHSNLTGDIAIKQECESTSSVDDVSTEVFYKAKESDFATGDADSQSSALRFDSTYERFHTGLRMVQLTGRDELKDFLLSNIDQIQGNYGVLIFLYSMLLTKGVHSLQSEIGDLSEPLIHDVYGYGSQSLVNLMLTGRAVQHVWDHVQNVGGLALKGIEEQSEIGFITLMEHMRYCTVGVFYKNPKYPIWVLGSETHLTVLFSFDRRLTSPEEPWEVAKREFRRYDPDGCNFIPFNKLQELLTRLGLVSDPEYIEVMRSKLDAENLGIILLSDFLDEFYPDMRSSVPEQFILWHYNGLPGSHYNNRVAYVRGQAILLESDLKSSSETDQMLTCLQTKWPNIELQWDLPNNRPPSLN